MILLRRPLEAWLLTFPVALLALALAQLALAESGHFGRDQLGAAALFAALWLSLHLLLAWRLPRSDELLLPLASKKDLLGFISLGPKKSEEPYSPSDTNLLRTVAAQTGLALENSRLSEAFASAVAQREKLNREIEIAREVQQRLFPQKLPQIPALEYAGHCRPAQG